MVDFHVERLNGGRLGSPGLPHNQLPLHCIRLLRNRLICPCLSLTALGVIHVAPREVIECLLYWYLIYLAILAAIVEISAFCFTCIIKPRCLER